MSLRLAVLQTPGDLGDGTARLTWLDARLGGLAGKADLVLCPELFAIGYNIGHAVRARAEPADGAIASALSNLAERHAIAVHCGFAEAAAGRIFNAVQCYGPNGRRLLHQRKLAIPPGAERDNFSAGEGCALFELNGLRIASLICYDIEFVEPARHVAALGADLILVPTALGAQWAWVARTMVPSRAYENGVYLAYANHCGDEGGLAFLGESFIAAPDGEELARAGRKEEVLLAEIDPARVRKARDRLPYLRDHATLRF
ncbi:carbon-nitrogen hydrolase family protein [Marimonas arenosa]|uniref:Carbon-nitrogen hydrolase family protein n=1 Tax=Marimonas arenosa TaxID=1795305 RepID=A0AAE4B314_9RHOB|nr:carbon-nitrogen hydrolase family protein [Marimonas arenosa]MDQ2088805.1 carbon-nitrogen hydrolase family protein [Marimonas arenosa]